MEHMSGFHRYRRHAKSSSTAATALEAVQTTNPGTGSDNGDTKNTSLATGAGAAVCMVREQDQYMPIANVIRIMRRILPSHAKISDDAKETIQECVSEYISFVTGEANERCQREQRKTVTADDVLWAMGKLGFDDYVQPLTLFLSRYREAETDRTSARADPFVKRAAEYGPPPPPPPPPLGIHAPYGPGFHMGHYPTLYDAQTAPAAMGGYFRDGSSGAAPPSGSSSHNALAANFDPFAHYTK